MMPTKVRAFCHFGKWHDIEVEDDVTCYCEYPNGATGVFITTTADAPGTNRFEVTGDKGTLLFDNGKVTFKKLDTPISKHLVEADTAFGTPKCEVIELTPEGENSQHVGILNNFADAVLGIEDLYAAASDGIKGVTLANAMLLSTWKNETIDLPFDGKEFYDLLQDRIKNSTVVKQEVKSSDSADLSNTYNN
jgi:predicted dehydrogenase